MNCGPELHHLPGLYEPFNAISHMVATALFAVLGYRLLRRGRAGGICPARRLFLGIYAFSCVFLFAMSAVFHMLVRGGAASRVLERLDHGAIVVLIAGTFTAIHGLMFAGWRRWIPLIIVWSVAITGITVKTVFFDSLPEWVGLSFYIGLGWGVGLTAIPIYRRHGFAHLLPLFAGGLAYSIGALMEFKGWFIVIPGVIQAHEIWHISVGAGALLHWWFVWGMLSDECEEGRRRENGDPAVIEERQ